MTSRYPPWKSHPPYQVQLKIRPPLEPHHWTIQSTLHSKESVLHISWKSDTADFKGYIAELTMTNAKGQFQLAVTGVDVSSDWKKFPRYGYLAHFDTSVEPEKWINELNKYHINGLQFYDFQYQHHRPLAGTVKHPFSSWKDIAGRATEASVVRGFIDTAHQKNMMTLAYNASYAAYANAFHDKSGVKLKWAAWRDATSLRTEKSIKSYGPFPESWSTPRLLFMNQNNPQWQNYIFSRMSELFVVYPFDGWHIDTYGDRGAFDFDGNAIDYIGGFQSFTNNAKTRLNKRILFNTVAGTGQEMIARSKADFVYSELWENRGRYSDILQAADEIRAVNPEIGIVFPAYLHKPLSNRLKPDETRYFNSTSVLLADAVIFASGASHLELGDDLRMLSTEYFPDNRKFIMSPELKRQLRAYYDFLVIYQNYLRDNIQPSELNIQSEDLTLDANGSPGKIWYFARKKDRMQILHLINFSELTQNLWRDDDANYPKVADTKNATIRWISPDKVTSVGWASPDYHAGRYQSLSFQQTSTAQGYQVSLQIPRLHHWDMIFIQ